MGHFVFLIYRMFMPMVKSHHCMAFVFLKCVIGIDLKVGFSTSLLHKHCMFGPNNIIVGKVKTNISVFDLPQF